MRTDFLTQIAAMAMAELAGTLDADTKAELQRVILSDEEAMAAYQQVYATYAPEDFKGIKEKVNTSNLIRKVAIRQRKEQAHRILKIVIGLLLVCCLIAMCAQNR